MMIMIGLEYIKSDIQNIAEAIVSVLNIDVTIVNKELFRIAGTGVYIDKIGEKVDKYTAFKKSLTEQITILIDDPKSSDICRECYKSGACVEFAEVCCPIICDGDSHGVIGLIAFTKEQAQIKTYELELEKKKLETLLNNMDKAVVSIDVDGKIDKYNSKFKELFNIKDSITGKNIFVELDFIKKPSINNFKKDKSCSFFYKRYGYDSKGIYNINKIVLKNELKGYVIDFIDKRDAIKNYNKMNKDYRIKLENIIGESVAIRNSKKEALIASKSTSTVLITGESGTGKELFARAIHNHSNRVDNPFIAVNCAAIPDNLLESELFGYEEGAFTGAKKGGKLGMFEVAHKGSIFLDEIGDMSLHLQSKLLRVLQEKELNKIGSKSNVSIDVRIIAATNKDLEKMVQNGTFREDLYYRLNVIPIKLPSLRERKEDIPLIIKHMVKEYSKKLDKNVIDIDSRVVDAMMEYKWPGNIRELQNIIEYSVNMSSSSIITMNVIPQKIKNTSVEELEVKSDRIIPLDELEKIEIIKALNKYKDYKKDKELTAKALGISRATLYRKIEKYNIIS
ncbi:sigma-54 interaction domain-containing protein [Clostridioides difficile]|uniref:sigma-54 interaction domain-containing protein n=1 Tax=Clostridioides difficile TaxID=1496 RepID=UPI00319E64CC